MEKIREKLAAAKIIPVVILNKLEDALPLAEILRKAKLPIIEITFRTKCAADAIKIISEKFPEICVGAGTILFEEELLSAKKAGATFCVSPGFDASLIKKSQEIEMPFIPGVATASEMIAAINSDCKIVKIYPVESIGGLPFLKSLLSAFRHLDISLMPTGGITEGNYQDYLALKEVICVGCSWVVDGKLISDGSWQEIERRILATKK